MKLKAIILSFLLFGVTSSSFAQKGETSSLESLIKQHVDAQTAFDRARLDEITSADYIEISPVGEFDPKAKMLDFYKSEMKPNGIEVGTRLSEFSTRAYDKFGVVIVRIDYTMTRGGSPMPPRSMRATFACRKEKGGWKIVSAQYTGIRPPASAPPK